MRYVRRRLSAARGHPGQMLVIVAVAMVALIGILGLAIDLGYSMAQQRAMQNAADAGAMAGAQALTKWSSSNNISVMSTVQTVVADNGMGPVAPTLVSCDYVDDSLDNLGSCSQTVPTTASGVQVVVSETHSTFVIRAIPGAPKTASTGAEATARVYQVQNAPGDAPFIVCGTAGGAAADVSPAPGSGPQLARDAPPVVPRLFLPPTFLLTVYHNAPTSPFILAGNPHNTPTPSPTSTATATPTVTPTATPTSGTTLLISNTSTINPAAVGQTFYLHGSQADTCGISGFHGLANNSGVNDSAGIPGWWQTEPGVHAGPTRFAVEGIQGCGSGVTTYGCVLLIPVADEGTGNGANGQMHVVAIAAFLAFAGQPPSPYGQVSGQCNSANCDTGVLLGQYTIGPNSNWPPDPQSGWLPGANGAPVMVRLVSSGAGLQ